MTKKVLILTSLVVVILLTGGLSVVFAAPSAQGDGTPEGFAVIAQPGNQFHPQVAYNSTEDEYLMVWSNGGDIFAQRLSNEGAANPPVLTITTSRGRQDWPAVAYDPDMDRYLIVWDDDRNAAFTGHDLFGRLFEHSGASVGPEFPVLTLPASQRQPRLTFNPDRDEFLLVWSDSRNAIATGNDIFGQLLREAGTPRGGSFSVSTAPADQTDPAVAYSSRTNDYLVFWSDNRDPESKNMFGQRVAPPNRIGAEISSMVDNASNQFAPSLSFDTERGEYLIVWCDDRGGPETFIDLVGRLLSPGGSPSAENFAFVSTTGDQASSGIAYDPGEGRHLAVWGDNRNLLTEGWDIFGVFWPFK
ncbi:MAG: hypothetical protein ACE5HA_12620 [Anaerolineae bacterium]